MKTTRARTLGSVLAASVGVYLAAATLFTPIYVRWGVSGADLHRTLPGDELVPDPTYQVEHAVLVHAPPSAVWPWLVQLGQDRGGFYSHSSLENLVGLHVRNADRIHPEWQTLREGDLVRAVPPGWLWGRFDERPGWIVARIEPERLLYLDAWGAFVLDPVDAGTTRLVVRTRGRGGSTADFFIAPFGAFVFEPIHFLMQSRMLLGIKERAEAGWKESAPPPTAAAVAYRGDR